jgi:hypothetical protein
MALGGNHPLGKHITPLTPKSFLFSSGMTYGKDKHGRTIAEVFFSICSNKK